MECSAACSNLEHIQKANTLSRCHCFRGHCCRTHSWEEVGSRWNIHLGNEKMYVMKAMSQTKKASFVVCTTYHCKDTLQYFPSDSKSIGISSCVLVCYLVIVCICACFRRFFTFTFTILIRPSHSAKRHSSGSEPLFSHHAFVAVTGGYLCALLNQNYCTRKLRWG